MKKLLAVAAFLLASTAAQAQYSFDYGGRTIRIDPDRGTVSIPGVYDNTGKRTKRPRNDQDGDRQHKPEPDQAKVDPQTPAAAPAKAEPVPAPANAPPEPSPAAARADPRVGRSGQDRTVRLARVSARRRQGRDAREMARRGDRRMRGAPRGNVLATRRCLEHDRLRHRVAPGR